MKNLNDYLRKQFTLQDIRIGQKIEWELMKHLMENETMLRVSVSFMQIAEDARLIGKVGCYRTFCFVDDHLIYYGYCPAGNVSSPEVTLPLKEIEETLARVDRFLSSDSTNKRWMNDLQLKTHVHVSTVMIQNYNNFIQNKNLRHNE